ncbi:1998_t:CDS:1, partial [Dentiscutata heterogama]
GKNLMINTTDYERTFEYCLRSAESKHVKRKWYTVDGTISSISVIISSHRVLSFW